MATNLCWRGLTACSFFQNGKLLAERDGVKKRSEELATEKDALKVEALPPAILTSFSHSGLVRSPDFLEAIRLPGLREAWLKSLSGS